ncbi:MAG: hypothetical protein ACSHX7_08170 [Luteolibacter sp.]
MRSTQADMITRQDFERDFLRGDFAGFFTLIFVWLSFGTTSSCSRNSFTSNGHKPTEGFCWQLPQTRESFPPKVD